jgi:hypothetical protein
MVSVGLTYDGGHFSYRYVVMVGALMPDDKSAAVVGPLFLALMMATGGLFVNSGSVPPLFQAFNKLNIFTCARRAQIIHADLRMNLRRALRASPRHGPLLRAPSIDHRSELLLSRVFFLLP